MTASHRRSRLRLLDRYLNDWNIAAMAGGIAAGGAFPVVSPALERLSV